MRQILQNWLCIAVLFMGVCCAKAQCPEGDIHLTTQGEVDNFLINYPDCTNINESLQINSESVTNLQGLENITEINGMLYIGFTRLENLSGLENLTSIGGLRIPNNNNLNSLQALSNLIHITDLSIKSNPLLISLEGLNGINTSTIDFIEINNNASLSNISDIEGISGTVTGNIHITNNETLTSLSGLSGIEKIQGELRIENNSALIDLTAFYYLTEAKWVNIINNSSLINLEGLVRIESSDLIRINGNQSLQSLSGLHLPSNIAEDFEIQNNKSLSNLTLSQWGNSVSIGGSFIIKHNPSLIDFNSMQNVNGISMITSATNVYIENNETLQSISAIGTLTDISGELSIKNNPSLTSLTGLEYLNPNLLSWLTIESSQNLSTCALPGICTYLSNGGGATISGNASGCNSEEEIIADCKALPDCPSGELGLITQSQIDMFKVLYPNCTEVEHLIIGHFYNDIGENIVTNLQGLQNITKVNGVLIINQNNLTNLEGLNSLNEITQEFEIHFANNNLENFQGLDNLEKIGSHFILYGHSPENVNPSKLVNLEGLENLLHIGGDLMISGQGHPDLISLQGINNLQFVGGIEILENPSLRDITALSNITSVLNDLNGNTSASGNINIRNNTHLTSLEGLHNITETVEIHLADLPVLTDLQGLRNLTNTEVLSVVGNHTLTNLEGLNNLVSPGDIGVGSNNNLINLQGLNSVTAVGMFAVNHNNSLNSLTGLESLEVVMDLSVNDNPMLTTMEGLNNLKNVRISLWIYNSKNLQNLEGLNNLENVGGLDNDGWFVIDNNEALENIEALENLTSLKYSLFIKNNPMLTSLSGLNAINHNFLTQLELINNPLLSYCSTTPICQYISGGRPRVINGNATGCNSVEEILDVCELSIEETSDLEQISLYPVPAKNILNISTKSNSQIELVRIYDLSGKEVFASKGNSRKLEISVLPAGTYLVSVKTEKGVHNEKIIKK